MAVNRRLNRPTAKKRVDPITADGFDLDALLHPAKAFSYPMNVVNDPDLTLNEKRAILSSWASDACAPEAAPHLRVNAAGDVVHWDDIMDALCTLDREVDGLAKPLPHYKRIVAKKRDGLFEPKFRSRDPGDQWRVLN
jgi:hypothetical protein